VLHSITARFSLRPYDFVISHPFWNICHVTSRKLRLPQCIMRDGILQDKQFHLQIKAEQKEIIQNMLEGKDSMAECYQRASERACVTSPLFGQVTTSYFFLLMVICNSLLLLKSLPISSFHIHFGTFVTWLRENYDYRNVSWEMICI
jgi:hypothetical protein